MRFIASPKLKRRLAALAIAVLVLELVYVVAVNLFLSLGGIALLFKGTNQVNATFERAWTIVPGSVHIRNLRIVFQDHNLQWSLDIARVRAEIEFLPFAARTFHATSVTGEGTVFRMRHRVDPEDARKPYVAAFAPIPEFPGPAVFEARVPEAPVTDENYNLWSVHLENVDVGIKEAWAQQFRYVGGGRARGAFKLKPARTLWVGPASLDLEPGRLTAGKRQVSTLSGHIDCVVHPFDVRIPEGRQVFRYISTRIKLDASELSPEFMHELGMLAPDTRAYSAGGELHLDANLDHGRLKPSSEARITQNALRVEQAEYVSRFRNLRVVARALPTSKGEATLELADGSLAHRDAPSRTLEVPRALISLQSSSTDSAGEWQLEQARLDEAQLEAQDVAWFNRILKGSSVRMASGSARLRLRGSYSGGKSEGTARAELERVKAQVSQTPLRFSGNTEFSWTDTTSLLENGAFAGKLNGTQIEIGPKAQNVQLGNVNVQFRIEREASRAKGALQVSTTALKLSDGKSALTAAANFNADVSNWNVERAAGSVAGHGELRNVRIVSRDRTSRLVAPRARAKAHALRRADGSLDAELSADVPSFETHTPAAFLQGALVMRAKLREDAARNTKLDTQISVKKPAFELRHTQPQQAATMQASVLDVTSQTTLDAQGNANGYVVASTREFSARLGNLKLLGEPAVKVTLSDLNIERQTGAAFAAFEVQKVSVDDIKTDAACPWSYVEKAKVDVALELRREAGPLAKVSGGVEKARLSWGDFRAAGDANFQADLDVFAFEAGRDRIPVRVQARDATFRSGTHKERGWDAEVPVLNLQAELRPSEGFVSGPLQVTAQNANARVGRTRLRTDLHANLLLHSVDLAKRELRTSGDVRIRNARVISGTESVDKWWANVEVASAHVTARENLDVDGTFKAKFRDALPALKVLNSQGDLPGIVVSMFPLRELAVNFAVSRRCRLTEFNFTNVHAAPFIARGRLQSFHEGVRGAFLIQLMAFNPIAAGLHLTGDGTDVSIFAGNDWLADEYTLLQKGRRLVLGQACPKAARACGE